MVHDRRIRNCVSLNLSALADGEIQEDRMILASPHPDGVIERYYIRPQHLASLAEDGTIIFAGLIKNMSAHWCVNSSRPSTPSRVSVVLDEYLRDEYSNVDVPRVSIWLRGRLLPTRERHGDEVKLGDGVRIISGCFTVKGATESKHSPDFHRGTVLEVDGVSLFSSDSCVLSISGVMLVDQSTLPAI